MIVQKNPLQSKKFLMMLVGLVVMGLEIMLLGDDGKLPEGMREIIVTQGVALLGYVVSQAFEDSKTKTEAIRLERADVEQRTAEALRRAMDVVNLRAEVAKSDPPVPAPGP